MTVSAVSAMHEHVHQWACRKKQPRQIRDEVNAMLGYNEEAADDDEQNEHLLHSSTGDVSLGLHIITHERLLGWNTSFVGVEEPHD